MIRLLLRFPRAYFAWFAIRRRLFWLGCGCCPTSAWASDADSREDRNRIRADRLRRLVGLTSRLDEDFWRSMSRCSGPFALRAFETELYHLTHDRLS